jgi:hypothetical protein
MITSSSPLFKYRLRERNQRRAPGEPHQVDPHTPTKRAIERKREELELEKLNDFPK